MSMFSKIIMWFTIVIKNKQNKAANKQCFYGGTFSIEQQTLSNFQGK